MKSVFQNANTSTHVPLENEIKIQWVTKKKKFSNAYDIFQRGRPAKDEISNTLEERLSIVDLGLKLGRVVYFTDVPREGL
jgi:hypothetical protein